MSLVIFLMILVTLRLRCISRSLGFLLKLVRNFVIFLNWFGLRIGLLIFSPICLMSVLAFYMVLMMSKYFHDLEFKACTPGCNINQMNTDFLVTLDCLRELCGFPLVLNCAYRSPEWDKDLGRSGNSWHTKGLAVDVRCYDARKRAVIVEYALQLGLSVGVYSSFLHIDRRPVSQQVCFYGL